MNLSAYQLLDSSWVKSYELGNIGGRFEKFFHYLIFGGDNNIEVITPNIPSIEIIEKKVILKIEYEV